AQLWLPAARIDVENLHIEDLSRREFLPQVRPARRARLSGGDESARAATGHTEQPDHDAGGLPAYDLHLDDAALHHLLRGFVRLFGWRRGVQRDLVIPEVEVVDDHFDLFPHFDDLLRVVDLLQG